MESCTCTDVPITIFRGDDTDGLGYQSIKGKITTVLDLTGCKAVFRYLGFTQTIDPIPESGRFIITIPSDITAKFPPGMGFASLRVYDQQGKVRTFTNRIPVFVTMTAPAVVGGDFTVEFSGGALNLEPLKIWTANGFVDYDGYIERIIDKATADRFGLAMLKDTFESGDDADSGIAATPKSVNAAYAAILAELTDNYYTAEETEEKIDSLAAYYITYNAAGDAFPTRNALVTATTYYSGGAVRIPTRNDYAVVLQDETHGGAEWRYIYATNGESGQWEAQYPIETNDYEALSNKPSINGVTLSGNKTSANLGLLSNTGDQTLDGTLTVGTRDEGGTIGLFSVAEGTFNTASGDGSHAEGIGNTASGHSSHAEGGDNTASGDLSHAEGVGNTAQNESEHAQGRYNASHKASNTFPSGGNTLSSIGFGTASDDRKNAVETMQDGKTFIYGLGGYDGTNPTAAGVKDLATAIDEKAPLASPAFTGTPTAPTPTSGDNSTKVATTAFVQNALGGITPGPDNTKLDSEAAAPDYDSTATYAEGEYVTYLGKLYYAKQAITTAEAWTAAHWQETDMTTPDATLDVTSQGSLRVVSAGGQTLWQQGYKLASASSATSATLDNEAVNRYDFTVNDTGSLPLTLPTPPTGKVGDFVLDVTNPALDTASFTQSAFDSAQTYAVGDEVVYDSKIWRCVTAVSTAGAWTGTTNWEEAWPYFSIAGLSSTLEMVVPKGKNLSEILTFAPGTRCELYFTLTSFAVSGKPTWKVVRQDVEVAS